MNDDPLLSDLDVVLCPRCFSSIVVPCLRCNGTGYILFADLDLDEKRIFGIESPNPREQIEDDFTLPWPNHIYD